MPLQDEVIVITGASRGIGKTLALAFADAGAIVVAAARKATGPDSIDETVKLITNNGGRAIAVQCDVASPEDSQNLINTSIEQFGNIDVLINNAGIYIKKDIVSFAIDDWDLTMAVNMKGVFLACKYVMPNMMNRSKGNIINISSSMGRKYTLNDLAYGASKAGLDRFSTNLANDVREYGIAVNSLCPGYVSTDMASHGSPEPVEVVIPSILWLAQQTASTFTAQVIDRSEFGHKWGPRINSESALS